MTTTARQRYDEISKRRKMHVGQLKSCKNTLNVVEKRIEASRRQIKKDEAGTESLLAMIVQNEADIDACDQEIEVMTTTTEMTTHRANYLMDNRVLGGGFRRAFASKCDVSPMLYDDGITEAEDREIKAIWKTKPGYWRYYDVVNFIAKNP